MDVTVVIPARNAASTISEQLDALARQIDAPEFEVVVVDNGSNDGTREVVLVHQQTFDRLRLIDEPSKLGANAARNAGVREARTTKVLMCDADDVVTPSWVRSLGDALDLDDLVTECRPGDVRANPLSDLTPPSGGWLPPIRARMQSRVSTGGMGADRRIRRVLERRRRRGRVLLASAAQRGSRWLLPGRDRPVPLPARRARHRRAAPLIRQGGGEAVPGVSFRGHGPNEPLDGDQGLDLAPVPER
jgi:glycosyltransferase involved in cell wall biosynthesis